MGGPRLPAPRRGTYCRGVLRHRTQYCNTIHAYQAGGREALRPFNPHPHTAVWDRQATTFRETFAAQPPHPVPEAGDRIKALTGVRRGPTPVRAWLKNGLGRRQTGPIPAQADPVAEPLCLDAQLTPTLDEAQAGRRHVFFVDAAHLVLGAGLGSWWCLTRILLPTYSPHRNLIARLWKLVKADELYSEYWWCLPGRYYPKFGPFKPAISDCLADTSDRHQAQLNTLLTLKFQVFKSAA